MTSSKTILSDLAAIGYTKPDAVNLPQLNSIPKFVITGGKYFLPKLTVFLTKHGILGDITPYIYDRCLIDMYCKIITENYDLPEMIIFEDDSSPVNQYSLEQCDKAIAEAKNSTLGWDCLFMGGNLLGNRIKRISESLWVPLDGIYCTHAVMYKKSAYNAILKWLEYNGELKDAYNGGHAIDHWIYESKLSKLCTNPMHFTQQDPTPPYSEGNLNLHELLKKSYYQRHFCQ